MAKSYPYLSKILKKLLFEREIKPVDLSRRVKIPQPTIHRLISGKSTRPYKSSLQPIADYFSISVEQLVGEESLENKLVSHDKSKIKSIPLLSWSGLNQHDLNNKSYEREIAVTQEISDDAFALVMPDSSMEPLFLRLSILIFDPTIKPADRSYALVRLHQSNKYIFRQLLVDLDRYYIKSLNPDLHTANIYLLKPEDQVVACLVESRNNYLQTEMDEYI